MATPGALTRRGAEGRNALGKHRIDQNVEAGGLDQEAGVADQGDAQAPARNARRRLVAERAGPGGGPCLLAAAVHPPFPQIGLRLVARQGNRRCVARLSGQEKPHAVEMVGDRPLIIKAARIGPARIGEDAADPENGGNAKGGE